MSNFQKRQKGFHNPDQLDFKMELFGTFNGLDIRSAVDRNGTHWFPVEVVADALQVDRSTVSRSKDNHPEEIVEGDSYEYFTFETKRRLFFSEEGFFRLLDMSTTERAMRLRRWMRQQFRVRQEGTELVVQNKGLPRDDLSDLDPSLAMAQHLLDSMADAKRKLLRLDAEQKRLLAEQQRIEEEHEETKQRLAEDEGRIAALEGKQKIGPGEMNAVQMAIHCKWFSTTNSPHNAAVVLAAVNGRFEERNLMHRRQEQDANGRPVEVCVFTPAGVGAFLTEINAQFYSGQTFQIAPNAVAQASGLKNKRTVIKQ